MANINIAGIGVLIFGIFSMTPAHSTEGKIPLPVEGTKFSFDCSHGALISTVTKVEGDTVTAEGVGRGKPRKIVKKYWQVVTPNLYEFTKIGNQITTYELIAGEPEKIADLELGSVHELKYKRTRNGRSYDAFFTYSILQKREVETKYMGPMEVYIIEEEMRIGSRFRGKSTVHYNPKFSMMISMDWSDSSGVEVKCDLKSVE